MENNDSAALVKDSDSVIVSIAYNKKDPDKDLLIVGRSRVREEGQGFDICNALQGAEARKMFLALTEPKEKMND